MTAVHVGYLLGLAWVVGLCVGGFAVVIRELRD